MTEKPDPPEGASFDQLRQLHFGGLERDIREGRHVEAAELARVIRARGDVQVPDAVIEYACAHLAGEVSSPKGRRPEDPIETRKQHMRISAEYQRLSEVLRVGELSADDIQAYGAEDNPRGAIRTPAERAARLVAARFLIGPESWRNIQNIASEYRRSQE